MARGRRRGVRRRPQRRTRRRTGGRRGFRRAVARVATRVINRAIETKILELPDQTIAPMTDATMYVHNPTYQIQEGTNDNERIGRKIQNAVLHVSFEYNHSGRNSVNTFTIADTSYLRMLLLASTRIKVTTTTGFDPNPAGLNAADVFYSGTKTNFSPVDRNRWTVLFDRTYKAHNFTAPNTITSPNTGKTGTIMRKNMRFKLGKHLTYYENTTFTTQSLLTGREYYLVFVATIPGGTGGGELVGDLDTNCQLHYKDA